MVSSLAMKTSFILLLLTLFSSMKTQARDIQFSNKVTSTTTNVVPTQQQPTTTTTNVAPNKQQPLNNNNQQQKPDFLPENQNGYGLYGHESGQLPPSTTATTSTTAVAKEPLHKYLPKNYNPVAYVTQPENIDDINLSPQDTYSNNLNNNENNYYNNNNQAHQEYKTGETEYSNYNYNGGSSFNSGPQVLSDMNQNRGENSFDVEINFQPQGMSDTRSMENGKYYYDINNQKFSENHPYESFKGVREPRNEYNGRNFYGNNNQNQYEFPDAQDLP